jgi:hypothetical protein
LTANAAKFLWNMIPAILSVLIFSRFVFAIEATHL